MDSKNTQENTVFDQLFHSAAEGLKEYYALLRYSAIHDHIKLDVRNAFTDTGNNQVDYQHVRDTIEKTIQAIENEPHHKIEFDLNYEGGDYDKVGSFIYIPESFASKFENIQEAFSAFSLYSSIHIICTYEDDRVTSDGDEYEKPEAKIQLQKKSSRPH